MRTLVFLCLFVSATAHAQLVTIDAGAHPTGTNLVSLTPGARITTLTNEGAGSGYYTQPVVTVPNTWATGAGPHFFGHNNAWSLVARWDFRNVFGLEGCFRRGGCSVAGSGWFNPLRVSFTVPTNYVEFRAHFPRDAIDGGVMRAFNSQGELLATCRFWGDVPGKDPQYGTYPTPTSPKCGELVRRYGCSSSGVNCYSEHLGRITRVYPDIAYVLFGGEAESATGTAATHVTFRRFSDDCEK